MDPQRREESAGRQADRGSRTIAASDRMTNSEIAVVARCRRACRTGVGVAHLVILRPMLLRMALAKPNARSSHRIPTPQGAGIAVIAATLIVAARSSSLPRERDLQVPLAVFGATLFIAGGRPRRRRQFDSGPAAAAPARARGRRRGFHGAGRAPHRSGRSVLDRTRVAAACRPLVRESRQLHGRARSDDGRRSRAGDGCRGPARLAR